MHFENLTPPCVKVSSQKRFTDGHNLHGFASTELLSRSAQTHISEHIRISSKQKELIPVSCDCGVACE